jgi:hypothetical protein
MTNIDIQKFIEQQNITMKIIKKSTEEVTNVKIDLENAKCMIEKLTEAFTGKIKNGK